MDGDNERPEVNMADYKLPDIPWHIGYVIKDEDAPRRHKLKCIYNDGKKMSQWQYNRILWFRPLLILCRGRGGCKNGYENKKFSSVRRHYIRKENLCP